MRLLIAQHVFKACTGARSGKAPTNLKPVGTGAYVPVDLTPRNGLLAAVNPNDHMALRPHFDRLEIKGGGDPMSAARAVLQTGDYNYAGGVLVKDELLQGLEPGAKVTRYFCPPTRPRRST